MNYSLQCDVPVLMRADVVVIGGGPGGFGAAVQAARMGKQVVLVERYGIPGGMASVGEVSPFMTNGSHKSGGVHTSLDRGLYLEWINRMRSYLSDAPETVTAENIYQDDKQQMRLIDRNVAALAIEELLLEAGVRILYHHTFFDAVIHDGTISEVLVHGKNGLFAIQGKVFIDSTGDGDLAAKAGAPFEIGNEEGYCQPMTTCFKLSHVDIGRMPDRKGINELYDKARKAGEINCIRENVLWFYTPEQDVIHFNTTRVVKADPLNPLDFSAAEIDGRRQVREYFRFLRKHVAGFEHARIHSIGTQIGVRESRRILGRDYLTIEAFEKTAKYPDAIARVSYPVDIHNPSGTGTILRHIADGDYYEIPYGCIIPRGLNNLLIGARCISVDHALHSSMRVMPPVVTIGTATGIAASMAIDANCPVFELDGCKINAALKEYGVIEA